MRKPQCMNGFALILTFITMTWAASSAAQEAALGKVHFPNSGASAAQEDFIRGVLYLHSFEYEPAATAFRNA